MTDPSYPTLVVFQQGGFSYNGAGVSVWVGCPYASYAATSATHANGGVTAQSGM